MIKNTNLPLSPYRALDMTGDTGYLCGKIFADLGADVIKIEPPGGDPGRANAPFYNNDPEPDKNLTFFAYNTNKRSITLDINSAGGLEVFRKLCRTADFVFESFAPGYLDKLGIGYSALSKINPRIIMVSITPFGQDGPYRDWKGSDIVVVAAGGLSQITGSPDRPPARVSVDQSPALGSIQGAMGAMIAHYFRQATGQGQHVDVSMQQCMVLSALTVPQAYDLQKFIWPREGSFLSRSGKRVRHLWPCKDGFVAWRMFGGGLGVKTRALVEWMESLGQAGELAAVVWQKMDYLSVDKDKFYHWQDLFGAFFKTRTKAELTREALARGIVLIAANTPQELMEDPQLKAREYWVDIEHEALGATIKYPGAMYKSTEIDWTFRRAPLIGEHNNEVYTELGLSGSEMTRLKSEGII